LARFEPSDVYGALPSATALVIAYSAGHLCLAYQPQIARSQLIVARRIVVAALAVDLTILICWTIYSALAVHDIVRACVVSCYCRRGHHSQIFIYSFAVQT
jgi:hypothetical protein